MNEEIKKEFLFSYIMGNYRVYFYRYGEEIIKEKRSIYIMSEENINIFN